MRRNFTGEKHGLKCHPTNWVAVSIDGSDPIGVFTDPGSLGIHTESTKQIAVLFRTVDGLALIQSIS